jgi:hypothetical protein
LSHGGASAGATGTIDITGTVTNQSGTSVSNVSVYATAQGGSKNEFGPVTTSSDGAYDLITPAGNYDFHYVPGSGSGLESTADSNVTVLNSQTINEQLAPITNTLSGTLTDNNGNPIPNMTITVNAADGNTASALTDTNGNYSIAAPPDAYSLTVANNSNTYRQELDGLNNFTLSQYGSPIDLTNGNVTQNLELNLATIQVTVEDANGNPLPNVNVDADVQAATGTSGGTTYLYPGDPGESGLHILDSTVTTNASGVADVTAVVGTIYGVGNSSSNPYTYLCATISGDQVCLPQQTVTGNMDVVIEETATIPSAPTNLTATSPTTTSPSLIWNPVSGATSYSIYRNGTDIGSNTTNSYTDSTASPGTYTYYVTAVNSAGESAPSNSVNVTVESTPTITSAASTTVDARVPMNFVVTTTGSPKPGLTESGSLPTGIAFTDNGNGTATFSGQASTTNKGIYFITITATNSVGTTSQNFVLSVDNVQSAPTFLNASSVTESYNTPFSFTIDTTGDPIPTISKLSGSGSLPNGVTLKDNGDGTATLSGTVTKSNDVGTYNFTIKAKNNNGTATQAFTLTIS